MCYVNNGLTFSYDFSFYESKSVIMVSKMKYYLQVSNRFFFIFYFQMRKSPVIIFFVCLFIHLLISRLNSKKIKKGKNLSIQGYNCGLFTSVDLHDLRFTADVIPIRISQ